MRSLTLSATLASTLLVPTLASAGAPSLTDAFAVRAAPTLSIPARPAALQDEEAETEDTGDGEKMAVQAATPGRRFDMELGFRGRYMNVPDAILDIWFYDIDDDGYAYSEARPQVHAYTVGLEFVIKSKVDPDLAGGNNGIFWIQWVDNMTGEGYWDDVESPHDPFDGDYIVPTNNLGMVALGADYAYELHMVKTMNTNGNFGMSMLVGAGLGVGVLIGQIDYCRPNAGTPSYQRCTDRSNLEPEPKRLPPVFPILDVNIGMRFNFGDRFVIRLEGGVHDMIYGGGSVGLMF